MMFKLRIILFFLVFVANTGPLSNIRASSIGTQWQGLANTIALKLEAYTRDHDGRLPATLSQLFTDSERALLEEQLGAPLESRMEYLGDEGPNLKRGRSENLVALISFPIREDRRENLGRYLVYRSDNGKIGSRWESDDIIISAMADVGVTLSNSPIYEEKPIKPLYAEYSTRLIEDAIKQGIPISRAIAVVGEHVDSVVSGRVEKATTWAEIAAAATPTPPAAETSPTTESSRRATATPSITETSEAEIESSSNVPWLIGIAVIAVVTIGSVVMRRKT